MCWKSREAWISQNNLLRKLLVDYATPFFLWKTRVKVPYIYIYIYFMVYHIMILFPIYTVVWHMHKILSTMTFFMFLLNESTRKYRLLYLPCQNKKNNRGMNNWAQGIKLLSKKLQREENFIFLFLGRTVPICSSYGVVSKHSYLT